MKGKLRGKHFRQAGIVVCATALCCCLSLSAVLPSWRSNAPAAEAAETKNISKIDGSRIDNHIEDFYSTSTTEKLSDTVSGDELISLIVRSNAQSVLEAYHADAKAQKQYSVSEYQLSSSGLAVDAKILKENRALQAAIASAGIPYTLGNSYDVLFGGFEISVRARYFDQICSVLDKKATVIVGEVYAECETVSDSGIVTNDVNVYDTGIFDSSDSAYDGSGVVIAVLDTGLDYTHSAFDVNRFEGEEVITLDTLAGKVGELTANNTTAGLKAEDVYINEKIPFAYDYADGDSDVFPINSEHGTHVSGIIVGNDDEITGVAPNAQLAFIKVFSEEQSGAKTSWILAGLEDCVKLGVDVINMSLGSASGFSREVDKENVQSIYDSIAEHGISLVTAAGNDYSSIFGSEKNGNLGLTTNPDSGVVGSPSTYEAALSVASVSGVKTPYLTSSVSGDTPIYLTEASGTGALTKSFVDEIFAYTNTAGDSLTLEYVVVPGVGRNSDYGSGAYAVDVKGKIALVLRGSTNFEEKAMIAKQKGAVGCIIYNNVSGDISMSVGAVGAFPVCSISQDDGKMLAGAKGGTITISRSQVAGPFMSNFSSWGPTPNLGIKPEITAHGGDIYSAVPGQSYDRLSGTSMAAPNQSGVTALIRQYVKEKFPNATVTEVTALVNQIMMSTTDIVYNKNGLAYSVRKQGAGLANLTKATSTPAYLRSYDADGNVMDRTKFELGDDKNKKGEYSMTFDVVNTGSNTLSYDVSAIVMTEGISDTLTNKGLMTVTEEGYALSGASVGVSVASGGSVSGNTLTVNANATAKVTVTIRLSDEDKAYLEQTYKIADADGNETTQSIFANGMYVEGFVKLTAKSGTTVDLNAPYLAFYGDWTQAPLFDLDYFATNKDELDDSIDLLDKTLPDAYATRPVGGLYSQYIVYLGSYAFTQDPSATKIAADRKYIALSNQSTGDAGSSVHSISEVYAGLLRSAAKIEITVTNAVTGEEIFRKEELNVRKAHNYGSAIYGSTVDVDFDLDNYDLKNNTQYIFTMKGYLDYGEDGGSETNANNTFSFPFVVDFQAPVLTDAVFRSEYDKDSNRYRVYVDLSVYDNHYSEAAMIGYVSKNEPGSEYTYSLNSFGRYITALYSDFNSTTTVTYELTDYLDQIKQNSYDNRSFIVQLYDYAQNTSTYEVSIPDNITQINFVQNGEEIQELDLSVNETFSLSDIIKILPSDSWIPSLNFESGNENVVRVVNGKLVGVAEGTTYIKAISNADPDLTATLTVNVIADGKYDKPVADSFVLTGYTVNKVYYMLSSDDRDLGVSQSGAFVQFATSNYSLKMYPSESVTIGHRLYAYFEEDIKIDYTSDNENIATVDEDGTIVAQSEGSTTVTVRVLMKDADGTYKTTFYSQSISITVKNPYDVNSIYLFHYYGLGGEVKIPEDLGITEIYQYAFANYNYIDKDANDVIDEEDPLPVKIHQIGDDTITKVIIPEGVEVIGAYAFAELTALKEVVLPSTLTKIQGGAFYGCTALDTVTFSGANNLQFINNDAFNGCTSLNTFDFDSIIAIGDRAFQNSGLVFVTLPATAQSIAAQAFSGCADLQKVTIKASKVKLGSKAFASCPMLTDMTVNASVIPEGLFNGCEKLTTITLGRDVSVINNLAFAGTNISTFNVASGNPYIKTAENGSCIVSADGSTLLLVSPKSASFNSATVTAIGEGAFSGNETIRYVNLPNVTKIGAYTFALCTSLNKLVLGELTEIGDYAFFGTALTAMPQISSELTEIGDFAFYGTALKEVSVPAGVKVGDYAFAACVNVTSVTIGDGAVIGNYAFVASPSLVRASAGSDTSYSYYYTFYIYTASLTNLTVGNNVTIGNGAFLGAFGKRYNAALTQEITYTANVSFGEGISVGARAFYNCDVLAEADLSGVAFIGAEAFSGDRWPVYAQSIANPKAEPIFIGYADELLTLTDSAIERGERLFQTPALKSVNLTSAQYVGTYAFAFTPLASVTFGSGNVTIGEGAFYGTDRLATLDLGGVTKIGDGAFFASPLTQTDLSNVAEIGSYAFYANSLTAITLKEGASVGDYAFASNKELAAVGNLDKAVSLGAYAFANTALSGELNLAAAQTVGDFAFSNTNIISVAFGDLLKLGENPFAGCPITAFTNDNDETTFDVGSSVKVIDGVLYRVAYNGGLELISYPVAEKDTVFKVAEGTIRIGARAFYNANLVAVELVRDVKAIGDRAFYGCSKLSVVTYKSIAAPILEEQYDQAYIEQGYNNILCSPQTATVTDQNGQTYEALGIVPFKMWNYTDYTNYFYGANFIDLIGHEPLKNHTLIMVRPVNGTGFENFVYSQYFDLVVDGVTAPTDATLQTIAMISALPAAGSLTLDDEAAVKAAREAYEQLSIDQQALVAGVYDGTNYYSTLSGAEQTIEYLKQNQNGGDDNQGEPEESGNGLTWLYVTLGVLAGIVAVLGVVVAVLLVTTKKKGVAKNGDGETADEADETAQAESGEDATDDAATADGADETAQAESGEDVTNDAATADEAAAADDKTDGSND